MVIRPYLPTEFEMVRRWWLAHGEVPPLPDMLPPDSTFILELHRQPALCVSLYLTNSPEICYVENFVGNPELKGEARREGTEKLLAHLEMVARGRGYRRLICLGHKPELKKRYQEIGFTPTVDNITGFAKEL
jgi:hypothetical protein